MTATIAPDPATIPGAFAEERHRELPDGALIDFEYAPAGYLTKKGEARKKDYRAYHYTPPGDTKRQRMISVTSLLALVLPKPGLVYWSEKHGILGAVEAIRRGDMNPETELDPVAVVRALHLGMEAARDRAADRGLDVHGLLEDYMRTGAPPTLKDRPVEHHGFVRGLAGWLLKDRPEPITVEEVVCSPDDGYAGRLDLIANIDGTRTLIDLKSAEKAAAYDSAHLQLGLLRRAMIASGDEPPEHSKVVVVAADGAFREMDCLATDETVQATLDFYQAVNPIQKACESGNRVERQNRKAAA